MSKNADYIKQETVTGVVPMLTRDRKYSFLDLFLTTSGFAIATWCYTQGAYVAQFLSFKQMIINIFCFNLVWVLLESLPIMFATRYGIDLWIWLRSVLGQKGVAILSTAISMANFGWYAVAANIFSSSMIQLAGQFGIALDPAIWNPVLGTFCVVLGTLIAIGGPEAIKWANRILVTALLAVGVIVVFLCFTSVPLGDIVAYKPQVDNGLSTIQNFMLSAEGNIAFAFSWSTQALVMPRLAKSERSGYWGTTAAEGFVAPFFILAGAIMAVAMFVKTGTYSEDPTEMLAVLCGPGVSLLSLLLVGFANIGTQGTGSYINCMIVKSGMPKVSYKLLVILACIYVSGLTIWGGVTEYFGAFISLAAYLQGPIIGMIIVDYLIVKKRKLSLKSAYFMEGHDAYKFTGGFNLVGIGCLVIAFAVAMIFVYNPMTGEIKSNLFLFTTGSGFTAIFGGLLYLIASYIPALRKYMLKDREDLEIQ